MHRRNNHYNRNDIIQIIAQKIARLDISQILSEEPSTSILNNYGSYGYELATILHRVAKKCQNQKEELLNLKRLTKQKEDFLNKWQEKAVIALKQEDRRNFNAQDLSMSMWAWATLREKPRDEFLIVWAKRAVTILQQKNSENFKTQELSNSMWALAKLIEQHPELLTENKVAIADFISPWLSNTTETLQNFNPQNLSNSMWALAKLCEKNSALLEDRKIKTAINGFLSPWLQSAGDPEKLKDFNPQDLSNSMWALAKLIEQHPELLKENKAPIADFISPWLSNATEILQNFNSQGLSNSMWALAKLCEKNSALLEDRKITTAINGFLSPWLQSAGDPEKLKDFNPQELSNSMWALAKLSEQHPELLKENKAAIVGFLSPWLSNATKTLEKFNPQGLSNSMWALAKLCEKNSALLENRKITTAINGFLSPWLQSAGDHKTLPEFNAQELSNSMWALAKLCEKNSALLEDRKIKKAINSFLSPWLQSAGDPEKLKEFNAQGLSNSMWALAKLCEKNSALPEDRKIKTAINGFLSSWLQSVSNSLAFQVFNSQGLSNSILALAKLSEQHPALLTENEEAINGFLSSWLQRVCDHKTLPEFNAQELSNSIGAWARLKKNYPHGFQEKNTDLFKQFFTNWFKRFGYEISLGEIKAQDLTESIRSVQELIKDDESLRQYHETRLKEFIQAWLTNARERLNNFCAQDLVNNIHVWARLKKNYPHGFQKENADLFKQFFTNWLKRFSYEICLGEVKAQYLIRQYEGCENACRR